MDVRTGTMPFATIVTRRRWTRSRRMTGSRRSHTKSERLAVIDALAEIGDRLCTFMRRFHRERRVLPGIAIVPMAPGEHGRPGRGPRPMRVRRKRYQSSAVCGGAPLGTLAHRLRGFHQPRCTSQQECSAGHGSNEAERNAGTSGWHVRCNS